MKNEALKKDVIRDLNTLPPRPSGPGPLCVAPVCHPLQSRCPLHTPSPPSCYLSITGPQLLTWSTASAAADPSQLLQHARVRAHTHTPTHTGGNNEAQVQGVGERQVITQEGRTRPGATTKTHIRKNHQRNKEK